MGSDRMQPRHVYEKSFTVRFPDRSEWREGFKSDRKRGLILYTDGSKTDKGTGTGVYCNGTSWKLSFGLGQYTTVFQAEVYAIKACVKENLDRTIEIVTSTFYLTVRLHLKRSTNNRSIPNCSGTATTPSWNWLIITGSNFYGYQGMRVLLVMKQQISWLRLDLNIRS
jgi:hypothetical protein